MERKLLFNPRLAFLILTILTGMIIFYPYLNYHDFLSQGDHGRELYSIKKVYEGAMPYKDFTLFNGPLMLYYYSAFFHIFGVSIQSVLLGYNTLIVLTGVMVYLAASIFLSPPLSFLCALWYWTFRGIEFFYSYNHIGALFLTLLVIYVLFLHIRSPKVHLIFLGSLLGLCLCFVRVNIGIGSLLAYFISLSVVDKTLQNDKQLNSTLLYFGLMMAMALIVTVIYGAYFSTIPNYAFHDMGYWQTIQSEHLSIQTAFKAFLRFFRLVYFNFTATLARTAFGIMLAAFIFRMVQYVQKEKILPLHLKAMSCLFIFAFLNLHEYLIGSSHFRLNWSFPIFILIIFFIIGFLRMPPLINAVLLLTLLIVPMPELLNRYNVVSSMKTPSHLLSIDQHQVYIANDPGWIQTVKNAVQYIKQHTKKGEHILAIPYDPLYYFLTDRDSAIRDLELTIISMQSSAHEAAIITDIERKDVHYILVSNRAFRSVENDIGIFGKDFAPSLFSYINKNFEPVATFGDWGKNAGWATNHGVEILRRKNL